MTRSETQRRQLLNRKRVILGAGLLLILAITAYFLIFSNRGDPDPRHLKPERDTAVTAGFTPISQEAQTPDFNQLYNSPLQFKDQLIRVTAAYTPLNPVFCSQPSGPIIQYALVSGGLRMEAVGFERVLRLLPDGFTVTVEGFWRQYEGPLGCGSRPQPGVIWYLDVIRIIEPNPMPNLETPVNDSPPPAPGETAVPANATPTPSDGTAPPPTVTVNPSASPTPTRLPGTPPPDEFSTPTPGPSPTNGPFPTRTLRPTPSNTPPPGTTPTPTNTPPPPGSSPTPTTDPLATATPVNNTPPPATATPDNGYPGPSTPTPTPIPSPYP